MNKPTERFTKTVQDYIKYRPLYPKEVLQLLINECGLLNDQIIADIGSGTGFLSKLLLDYGNTVYGVEPNQLMRAAGEKYLQGYKNFHSIDGSAEATTLDNASINMITVGAAFHWFDMKKTKIEFNRILKKDGWVILVWEIRCIDRSALMRDYEALLLKYSKDYKESNARKLDDTEFSKFYYPNEMHIKTFENSQQFDWEGLKGRLLSTSYSLRPGDDRYEEMLKELRKIFDKYQRGAKVNYLYDTKVNYGHIHDY